MSTKAEARLYIEERCRPSSDGCWIWDLVPNPTGYGTCKVELGGVTYWLAHRLAYAAFVGDIPEGMTLDHACYQTRCVNPAHLRPMTGSQNASLQRSGFKTHCANGHEYTPENTYHRPVATSGGRRDCRTCIRARVAAYQARKGVAA